MSPSLRVISVLAFLVGSFMTLAPVLFARKKADQRPSAPEPDETRVREIIREVAAQDALNLSAAVRRGSSVPDDHVVRSNDGFLYGSVVALERVRRGRVQENLKRSLPGWCVPGEPRRLAVHRRVSERLRQFVLRLVAKTSRDGAASVVEGPTAHDSSSRFRASAGATADVSGRSLEDAADVSTPLGDASAAPSNGGAL